MVKSGTLILRIEPALKDRLQNAARALSASATSFATAAITRAIEQTEEKLKGSQEERFWMRYAIRKAYGIDEDGVFRGVPTFLRAAIAEARLGGENGYRSAGWTFAIHVASLLAQENDEEEVGTKLDELRDAVNEDETRAFSAWLRENFPGVAELVPYRRRGALVTGIRNAIDEGRVEA